MSSNLILLVGGSADATAVRLNSSDDDSPPPSAFMSGGEMYRLVRLRGDTRGPRLPLQAYVHSGIPDRDVSWHAFMSFMRAFDKSVVKGGPP